MIKTQEVLRFCEDAKNRGYYKYNTQNELEYHAYCRSNNIDSMHGEECRRLICYYPGWDSITFILEDHVTLLAHIEEVSCLTGMVDDLGKAIERLESKWRESRKLYRNRINVKIGLLRRIYKWLVRK